MNEKRLSRTMRHAERSEYAILTAWRSGLTLRENKVRMEQIEGDLSTQNYGYIDMVGVGQEHGGKSYEQSLMVINHDNRPHFKEIMLDLATRYDQDFIIHGRHGVSHLIDTHTGESVQRFTSVERGQAEYYSAIRGSRTKKPQAFHLQENRDTMKNWDNKKMLERFETFRANENDLWEDNPDSNFVELIELYCDELLGADLLAPRSAAKLDRSMQAFRRSVNALYEAVKELEETGQLPDDPSMPTGEEVLELFLRNFQTIGKKK